MIGPYPFFGFPGYRRPYPNYYNYNHLHNSNMNSVKNVSNAKSPSFQAHKDTNSFAYKTNSTFHEQKNEDCNNLKEENIENNSDECFEILGLKLYFDDLLIIALLFFLYEEDVKDTYLYIALILLLLS